MRRDPRENHAVIATGRVMVELAGRDGVTFEMYEEAFPQLETLRWKKIDAELGKVFSVETLTNEDSRGSSREYHHTPEDQASCGRFRGRRICAVTCIFTKSTASSGRAVLD